jgi:hypothetical protein
MSATATLSTCRRNYLRRMYRMGMLDTEPFRQQILRDALTGKRKPPTGLAIGWTNCRLCDREYKPTARNYLKGFAIVRCPDCGVWQRPRA